MIRLPNIISGSRIVMAGALFLLTGYPIAFLVLYGLCGLSDVADGYLARKLKAESDTGALLDTLGDVVMYGAIVFVLLAKTTLLYEKTVLVSLAGIVGLKLINLAVTRVRFGTWGVVHTWAYKGTGLLVFLILPVYYLDPDFPVGPVLGLCVLAGLAAVEELLILTTAKTYAVNRRSLFGK